MDRDSSMFRPEALEHRASVRGPGDVVRFDPRWTTWAFWALIALVVIGIAAASVVDIKRFARGATAAGSAGRVVVLVPAALAPEVAAGHPVELGNAEAEVVSVGASILYPPDIAELYGVDVTVPSVAVITSARSDETTPGSARVLIESQPLIVGLVPGLGSLFGGEGD